MNALFRVGGDLLARLPLVPWGADGVRHEQGWLPRLTPLLPLETPELVGQGEPDHGLGYPAPWSMLRWIDGVPAEPEDDETVASLATDLASFIASMRMIDVTGAPPAYRGGPLADRDQYVRENLDLLHDDVDTALALRLWEESLAAPAWASSPVWVHSDLMPGNLLTRDGRLVAVIDFAASGVGDPACDLMPAWSLLTPSARETFRMALATDEAMWVRGRGWALSQAVGALPYYRETNPAMASVARHVLEQICRPSVLADGRTAPT